MSSVAICAETGGAESSKPVKTTQTARSPSLTARSRLRGRRRASAPSNVPPPASPSRPLGSGSTGRGTPLRASRSESRSRGFPSERSRSRDPGSSSRVRVGSPGAVGLVHAGAAPPRCRRPGSPEPRSRRSSYPSNSSNSAAEDLRSGHASGEVSPPVHELARQLSSHFACQPQHSKPPAGASVEAVEVVADQLAAAEIAEAEAGIRSETTISPTRHRSVIGGSDLLRLRMASSGRDPASGTSVRRRADFPRSGPRWPATGWELLMWRM